ncbi:MAG: hypothetical protein R6V04_07655 [bacterium]
MKKIFVLLLIIIVSGQLEAQAGSLYLDILIDTPTAKILESGQIQSQLRMYHKGGLLSSLSVGITDRFFIGISYGGENIIGSGNVHMNPLPCVRTGYLLFKEQYLFPAILLGFNSQGYGAYNKDQKRYLIKSKGLYTVVSKNTSFFGGLGIHFGINWSLENGNDKSPNVFAGCHKWINSELLILAEYDLGLDDNTKQALGSGKGYLNCGVRWNFSNHIFFEFDWKNIFENNEDLPGSSREIKMFYLTHF